MASLRFFKFSDSWTFCHSGPSVETIFKILSWSSLDRVDSPRLWAMIWLSSQRSLSSWSQMSDERHLGSNFWSFGKLPAKKAYSLSWRDPFSNHLNPTTDPVDEQIGLNLRVKMLIFLFKSGKISTFFFSSLDFKYKEFAYSISFF